jgi:hypothetical protein
VAALSGSDVVEAKNSRLMTGHSRPRPKLWGARPRLRPQPTRPRPRKFGLEDPRGQGQTSRSTSVKISKQM